MPRGIQVLETLKQTQAKPSTWAVSDESSFQLCFCLKVFETRELPRELASVESKHGLFELEVVVSK